MAEQPIAVFGSDPVSGPYSSPHPNGAADLARQSGIAPAAPSTGPTSTGRSARLVLGAPLVRLARRLGLSLEELAKDIPEDNRRRSMYPVIEQRNEDGTTVFIHPSGITDEPRTR